MTTQSAAPVGAPAAARRISDAQILRMASIASMVLVAAGVVLWTAVPGLRGRDLALVGVIGLLLGIPHGSVDYLLPPTGSWPVRPAVVSRLIGLYLVALAAMLAIVLVAPVIAYWAIIIFAVGHWGIGDAVLRRERHGEKARIGDPVEILAYGGFIVVSAAYWPDRVRDIIATIAPGVAEQTRAATLVLGYLMVAAMVTFSVRMLLRRRWLEAGEVALLLVLAIATPPIVAFGLYFGLWHAVRQTTRLFVDAGRTDRTPDAGAGTGAGTAAGPAIDPAGLFRMMVYGTVGAFATMLVIAVVAVTGMYPARVLQFRATDWAMAGLVAATAPHVVVVLRYDLWKIRKSRNVSPRPSLTGRK